MDISKLAMFLDTVNIGSMKKAAEKYDYTPTGIFYLINSIEEELGVDLTNRDYKGIKWNKAGEEMAPYLCKLVEVYQDVINKIEEIVRSKSTQITVGAYPSIASLILPEVVNKFINSRSDASVTLRMGNHELISLLDSGAIDLAVMRKDDSREEGYNWIPLMDMQTFAAIPKAFIDDDIEFISIEDFSKLPFLYSSSNPVNEEFSQLLGADKAQRISVSTLDGLGTLRLVSQELGATAIMSLYKDICPANVIMVPFNPPVIHSYYVVQKISDHMKPLAKEFAGILSRYCEEYSERIEEGQIEK